MQLTPYHARYYALLLTQRWPMSRVERYLPALLSANIDLHPHQIDAALFASRSQFQNGMILADEEGLGKTIEAGLALLQASLEDKIKLLVLCPANLCQHWQQELEEKFSLSNIALSELGLIPGCVLLSYAEAQQHLPELTRIAWDLCVLDEAHLLTNAARPERTRAEALRKALQGSPKLLLTATPMQNSLLDLYYLLQFVDETSMGGGPELYRARYMGGSKSQRQDLAQRAQMLCQRTLKSQALTMPFTRRMARTVMVKPSPAEQDLAQNMSAYFHRPVLAAFPKIQEHYLRLIYWKLLASSPPALYAALQKLKAKLGKIPDTMDEQQELEEIAQAALAITLPARAQMLLDTLPKVLEQLAAAGAREQAVIFSENRATLSFLYGLLQVHDYAVAIYAGGTVDRKMLHDFATGRTKILLTTDNAGLGLDLSFCASVINYDLPWNVQKLEQRISRCHRYGQKHDVLVVNFVDPANRADRRIYQLLNRKLKAFDHIFGASETVLGQLESTADATEDPRTLQQIAQEQTWLEQANQAEIAKRIKKAEADILVHFDPEVQKRFREYGQMIPSALSRLEHLLWELICYKLRHQAHIFADKRQIMLRKSPYKDLRLTRRIFGLDKTLGRGERLTLQHPLIRRILRDCLQGQLAMGSIILEPGLGFVSGMSGELGLWQVHMLSPNAYHTNMVLCGVAKNPDSRPLSQEDCLHLLSLPCESWSGGLLDDGLDDAIRPKPVPAVAGEHLAQQYERLLHETKQTMLNEHNEILEQRLKQLRQWAEDEDQALSLRQKIMLQRIAEYKSSLENSDDFSNRFQLNKELAELEKERRAEEERLFYLKAEIDQKRDELVKDAQEKFSARFWDEMMFIVQWKIR